MGKGSDDVGLIQSTKEPKVSRGSQDSRIPPSSHEPLQHLNALNLQPTPYTLHSNAGVGTRWGAGTLGP